MKYGYTVKHNGVYYPAGADVPAGEKAVAEDMPDDSQITFETDAVVKKHPGRPKKQ